MTSEASKIRFQYPQSSLSAAVALPVRDFIDTPARELVSRLEAFIVSFSGKEAGKKELESWSSSIPAMQGLLNDPRLLSHTILIEVIVPHGLGRMDFVLLGADNAGNGGLVIFELKAWSGAARPAASSVLLPLLPDGAKTEPRAHPSSQAFGYLKHLRDLLTYCHEGTDTGTSSCCFLYNLKEGVGAPFTDEIFKEEFDQAPVFSNSQREEARDFIAARLPNRATTHHLDHFDSSPIAPSPALIERFGKSLSSYRAFNLTDDQIEAFNRIVNAIDNSIKGVFIVKGGPGTGKTVLALNLLKHLSEGGIGPVYAARSRAIIYFYNDVFSEASSIFANSKAVNGKYNCLIVDEAHRLSDQGEIKKCMERSTLSIFLIDENQIILPRDIRGVVDFSEVAKGLNYPVRVIDLEGQKRCGSEAYIEWIDEVLAVRDALSPVNSFDYRLEFVDSPDEMEEKVNVLKGSSRFVAGYCWHWSPPNADGTLVNDVIIGGYERPWNVNPKGLKLGHDLYRAARFWATDPAARAQIGCIYTAQSFEFDNVGVIFGKDLVYRNGAWLADLKNHADDDFLFLGKRSSELDPIRVLQCLKNIYRVLLTRGRRTCFVFVEDEETREYLRSRAPQR